MANGSREHRPHIQVRGTANAEPYTYPHKVRGPTFNLPSRNRAGHSARLLADLRRAHQALDNLHDRRRAIGVAEGRGLYLELESEPGFELMLKSLERSRDGIELVAVRERGHIMLATVFVAEGKLQKLEQLIRAYRDEDDSRSGQAKNKKLVESITGIRQAVLESFWTDDEGLFPAAGLAIWWEVWLRVGHDPAEMNAVFSRQAQEAGMQVQQRQIKFTDRTVVLVFATPEQMRHSVELLDCLAELRLAKDRPDFFMSLDPRGQAEWIADLLGRTEQADGYLPSVCILDTGVNNGHPLLRGSLDDEDQLTCEPAWGTTDHLGHGTEMAGLSLFGDLTSLLAHRDPVTLEHCLESVKILPPPRYPPNDHELYGSITLEAMGRIEVQAPRRRRVYCMAVTAPDHRDRGRPSSWSAAVDMACCGLEGEHARLVIVAAGNVDRAMWSSYPDRNDVDQVHDPGQSWNALTVGALTDKVQFDAASFPGWTPIARPGGLCPSSTTSLTWASPWPNKPDIVLEGGNGIREPGTGVVDTDDSLLLLTTHWRPTQRLFTTMGDTSAATAQAARMAAVLQARYPEFWPETIRGLLVHSAEWTPEMHASTAGGPRRNLLRRYGYGQPDFNRACWSAANLLTLVAQDHLTPFEKRGSTVRTKDMNLHELPWPREELLALGPEPVELRVTLSYFVEPNPARRGWKYRHRYQSHALRFAIRAPAEDLGEFRARVSRDAQDEESGMRTPDDPGWVIGPRLRNQGSIHSDRWHGTAADLAERYHLAIYPVGGWWKEQPSLDRWQRKVRYSLIVTIKTPEVAVDIYTPIATRVAVEVGM